MTYTQGGGNPEPDGGIPTDDQARAMQTSNQQMYKPNVPSQPSIQPSLAASAAGGGGKVDHPYGGSGYGEGPGATLGRLSSGPYGQK